MVGRYTNRDKHGHWYTNVAIHDRGLTCDQDGKWNKISAVSAWDGEPIDKLASYENSDLEPGEVLKLSGELERLSAENAELRRKCDAVYGSVKFAIDKAAELQNTIKTLNTEIEKLKVR